MQDLVSVVLVNVLVRVVRDVSILIGDVDDRNLMQFLGRQELVTQGIAAVLVGRLMSERLLRFRVIMFLGRLISKRLIRFFRVITSIRHFRIKTRGMDIEGYT